jgi:hypothetical protein
MDFHLTASSAAVDAGIATSLAVDMDNQPRPNPATSLPDIGADEVWDLTSVTNVEILAPALITATLPVTLTASLQPVDATPLVSYLWYPEPLAGQGTAEALYTFNEYGAQAVWVWAINAGNQVSATLVLDVQPFNWVNYFPLVSRH